MKKRLLIFVFILGLISSSANASVFIQYHNKDSKSYTFEVKIAGVMTKVEFGGNRTSSVTIQGADRDCVIYTPCGEVRLVDNVKITISGGCIVVGS